MLESSFYFIFHFILKLDWGMEGRKEQSKKYYCQCFLLTVRHILNAGAHTVHYNQWSASTDICKVISLLCVCASMCVAMGCTRLSCLTEWIEQLLMACGLWKQNFTLTETYNPFIKHAERWEHPWGCKNKKSSPILCAFDGKLDINQWINPSICITRLILLTKISVKHDKQYKISVNCANASCAYSSSESCMNTWGGHSNTVHVFRTPTEFDFCIKWHPLNVWYLCSLPIHFHQSVFSVFHSSSLSVSLFVSLPSSRTVQNKMT